MLAVTSLAGLAACGSASDALTFAAPPGYTQAASIGPFVQVWNTADKKNVITLIALPTKIDLDKAMSQSDIKDAQVNEEKHIAICGNQKAIYADIIGESTTGQTGTAPRKMHIEFLATNIGEKTYMSIYLRPVGAPLDGAADRAIHNICPK